MAENKLNDIISTSLEKIKALADGETVIGNPITTQNGTTVIPVSKVSVGFASGGVDYNAKKNKDASAAAAQNFGGGGGTGLTVSPVAFLIISPDGNVSMLPINTTPTEGTVDKVTSFIERSPELLEKFKKIFVSEKKKKKKAAGEAPTIEEDAIDPEEAPAAE